MARKTYTTIVALLMITSIAFAVMPPDSVYADDGTEFDETWITISSPEEFIMIGSGAEVNGIIFTSDGKYVQMNDIILDRDLNGGFDIVLRVSLNDNEVTVAVEYANGDIIETSACVITVNGVTIATNPATFVIDDASASLIITAGGGAVNIPAGFDVTDPNFAIATTFLFTGDGEKEITANSNGNMNPLSSNRDFNGTYNGNGYRIVGLETAVFSTDYAFAGMFGYIKTATLGNISIEGGSALAVSSMSDANAGGLVGYATGNVIVTDSYTTGDVYASVSKLTAFAGGLVAETSGDVIITDSYTTGNISSMYGVLYAGGLVGRAAGNATIINCYTTGNISSLSTTSYGTTYTGGLIGRANGKTNMTECYTAGDVTSSSAYLYSGGLAAFVDTAIVTNCYTNNNVTATATRTQLFSSGLVGRVESSITATNCYTLAEISATGTTVLVGAVVGGLRGPGYITNCYFLAHDGLELNGDGTPVIDGNEFRTTGGSGALTTEQLRDSNSYHASVTVIDPDIEFEGWDFDGIWYIDEDSDADPLKRFNYGLPTLTPAPMAEVPEEESPGEGVPEEEIPGVETPGEETPDAETPSDEEKDRILLIAVTLIVILITLMIYFRGSTN